MTRTATRTAALAFAGLTLSLPLSLASAPAFADPAAFALSLEQTQVAGFGAEERGVGIDVSLSGEDEIYEIGESVELSVTLDREAYLTVLNISHDGSVTVLFPNRFNPEQKVPGGVAQALPGKGARIAVAGPPGVELIKVLATDAPFDVTELGRFETTGVYAASGADSYGFFGDALSRLTRALGVEAASASEKTAAGDDGRAWGEATVRLVAVEKGAAPASAATSGGASGPASGGASGAASPAALALKADAAAYRTGDPMAFEAAATRSCDLTVLAFSPDGDSAVLFPARPGDVQRLKAGETRKLGGYVAGDTLGDTLVRAFCARPAEARAAPAAEAKLASRAGIVLAGGGATPRPAAPEVLEAAVTVTVSK